MDSNNTGCISWISLELVGDIKDAIDHDATEDDAGSSANQNAKSWWNFSSLSYLTISKNSWSVTLTTS